MSDFVLDASALLALLRAEPGANRVAEVLDRAVMSAVNLAEVATVLIRNGMPEADAISAVDGLGVEIASFDEVHSWSVGRLTLDRGARALSLGDRACLALAGSLDAPALTADRDWARLKLGVQVETIR